MLNDLLEKLGIETDLDFEQFEKSEATALEESLQVIASYFDDCPDDLKNAIRTFIKLGLPLPEQEPPEESETEETEEGD